MAGQTSCIINNLVVPSLGTLHTQMCTHDGSNCRTVFNVGRLLIRVVTPRNMMDDLLRNVMIKTLTDSL